MSTLVGEATLKVGSSLVYDPVRGPELRETYKGTETGLNALASAFSLSGNRTEMSNDGGTWTLVVTFATETNDGSGSETPVDKWDISRDYYLEPIWAHPNVHSLAKNMNTAVSAMDNLAAIRRDIENALNGKIPTSQDNSGNSVTYEEYTEGPVPPTYFETSPAPWSAAKLRLYKLMVRGLESFETERCVISRVRSFSIGYPTRMKLDAIPVVYTTNSLISTFDVPAVIQAQLPDEPSSDQTPDGTQWAWKLRKDHSTINYYGKVEETREWVYSAWSTDVYNVI
jgi:hypothetical protein